MEAARLECLLSGALRERQRLFSTRPSYLGARARSPDKSNPGDHLHLFGPLRMRQLPRAGTHIAVGPPETRGFSCRVDYNSWAFAGTRAASRGPTTVSLGSLVAKELRQAVEMRPAINLIVYHGVPASDARWRPDVGAYGRPERDTASGKEESPEAGDGKGRCVAKTRYWLGRRSCAGIRPGRPALSALRWPDEADRHDRGPRRYCTDPRASQGARSTRRPALHPRPLYLIRGTTRPRSPSPHSVSCAARHVPPSA